MCHLYPVRVTFPTLKLVSYLESELVPEASKGVFDVIFFSPHSVHFILKTLYFHLSLTEPLSSQQSPPPLPAASHQHKQTPSITSLNHALANQTTELQSASECVQLQENWVLGSNVALESRSV